MKIFKVIIVGLVFLLASPQVIQAQRNYTQDADLAFKYKQYYSAIQLYKKAYSKVRNKVEKRRILFKTGECYRIIGEPRRAEQQYRRAIQAKYADPVVYLYYAEVLRDQEKYQEATKYFKKYNELVPEDPRGQMGLESCRNAQEWKKENPMRVEIENRRRLNTREEDFSPAYADKRYESLIFTSTRPDAGTDDDPGTGQNFSAIYISKKDRRDNWERPVSIDEDEMINTEEGNNGSAILNRKFNTLYFTRCSMIKNEIVACKIYTSRKRGRIWGEPEMLDIAEDSVHVGHPAISRNERTIYFSAEIDGGYGGNDIYKATRRRRGKPFGGPVNLGPNINSSGDDMFPTLRYLESGKKQLYYSSDGRGGMGGLDIFKSEFEAGQWTKAENMRHPLNSNGDDFGMIFSDAYRLVKVDPRTREETNCDAMGFFCSERSGGRGKTDIYEWWIPEIIFTLQGTIRDTLTLKPVIGARVEIVSSDGSNFVTKTDESGKYEFNSKQILKNTSYNLDVNAENYFAKKGKITTVGKTDSEDMTLDMKINPIPKEPITLPEIRYDLAKWDLKPQYQDSLDGLIQTMNKNPTLVIELASHTDFRGSTESNDELSLKRAKSVVDFLTTKGIAGERMVPKGYGERKPRVLKDGFKFGNVKYKKWNFTGISFPAGTTLTEEYIKSLGSTREKEAAHLLNRRTEFRILRDDYVPKEKLATDTAAAGVNIALNPADSVILFQAFSDTSTAEAILNGTTYKFAYLDGETKLKVNLELINDQMAQHKITIDNFFNLDSAITSDGTIKDGEMVYIPELRIGEEVLYDLEAEVVHDLNYKILLGKSIMRKFNSDFYVDEDLRAFIFPEN